MCVVHQRVSEDVPEWVRCPHAKAAKIRLHLSMTPPLFAQVLIFDATSRDENEAVRMPQAAEGRPCGPYEHAQALGRAGEHSCKFFRCGSALSQRKWPIFAFGTAPRGENEPACMRHPAGRRPRGPDQHARALGRVGEHFHKFFRCGSALSHCKSLDFAPDAAPRAPCGARTAVSVRSVCGVHRTRALMQKSAFRAPSYGTASRGAPFRPFLAGGAPRHRHRGGPRRRSCTSLHLR